MKNKAAKDHAYESLLIRDGYLTEGSASNVFIVKDSVIKTPRLSNKLLPGITRKFLTNLIESNELPFDECDITDKELLDADEIFCSSSTNPVVPIIQVNDKKQRLLTSEGIWRIAYTQHIHVTLGSNS